MLYNRVEEVTSTRINIISREFSLLSIYLVLFSRIILKELIISFWGCLSCINNRDKCVIFSLNIF